MASQQRGRIVEPGEKLDWSALQQEEDEATPQKPMYSELTVKFDVARAMNLRETLLQPPEKAREQLIEKAAAFKAAANKHFKGDPGIALKGYLTALWLLAKSMPQFPEVLATSNPALPRGASEFKPFLEYVQESDELANQLLLNSAFCCLRLRDAEGAVALSREAHARGPTAKSALRLAKATEGTGDLKEAASILAAYSSNPVCRRELELLRKRRRAEKRVSKKMFGRERTTSLYSEEDQRKLRAEARSQKKEERVVLDLSNADDEPLEMYLERLEAEREENAAAVKRISAVDAQELLRRRKEGVANSELASFYAEARSREAARVGALMTDDEKLTFANFCATPGVAESDVDAAFDALRATVDHRNLHEDEEEEAKVGPFDDDGVDPQNPEPSSSSLREAEPFSEARTTTGEEISDEGRPEEEVPPEPERADDTSFRLGRLLYLLLFYPFLASATAAKKEKRDD